MNRRNIFDELTPDGYSPTLGAYVLDDGTGRLVTVPVDEEG